MLKKTAAKTYDMFFYFQKQSNVLKIILNQKSCFCFLNPLWAPPGCELLPSQSPAENINKADVSWDFFSLYIIIGCLIWSSSFLRLLFQMSFTTELILIRFQVVLGKKEWIITHENPHLSKHRPIRLTQMWAGTLAFEDLNTEHLYVFWKTEPPKDQHRSFILNRKTYFSL